MEPQTLPTAPSAHHNHTSQPQRNLRTSPNPVEYTLNEKDAFQRQQEWRQQRGSQGSNGRSHDSVISHPFSPKASSPPSPSSSISSTGRKHRSITEIQPSPISLSAPPQAHLDPEKGHTSPHSHRSQRSATSNPDAHAVLYDSGEYAEKGPEDKAVQLLLFLSGPCALLSFPITIWSVFAILAAVLLQPLRLITTRPTLSAQITIFLASPLNLQLHLIYSFATATDYSPSMLVIVHLLSPFVAIGVAICAWTSACFWFFSAILGDPAGQDGHNDGKESILGVRNWWERWLSRALR